MFDLVSTRLAGFCDIYSVLIAEAVLLINIHQQIVKCLALILCPSRYFANETDTCRRILVAHLVVGQESEALLTATDILLLAFRDSNFTCYPLEAGIAIAQFHVVLLCHLCNYFGGNDGLHQEVAALKLAKRNLVLDDIVNEHHGCLVAIDNLPFSFWVAANDCQAVSIRIGSNNEVSI